MKCPECGDEMNHHADKLVYEENEERASLEVGGAVIEFHSCPGCGATASRESMG